MEGSQVYRHLRSYSTHVTASWYEALLDLTVVNDKMLLETGATSITRVVYDNNGRTPVFITPTVYRGVLIFLLNFRSCAGLVILAKRKPRGNYAIMYCSGSKPSINAGPPADSDLPPGSMLSVG